VGDGSKNLHIVLVHGFGGSIEYWRRLIPALSTEGYTVHAFDLLGLGLSEKPQIEYSIELWAEQVTDFVKTLGTENVVLVGNSFGSLISLVSATKLRPKGIVMLNCAVGMNNKNMIKSPKMNDFQRAVATFALSVIDLLFKSPLLEMAFNSFATKDQVSSVLKNLYPTNPAAVDDELADGFVRPSQTPGALEVLRQIYTGDPGPTPMQILDGNLVDLPLKVIWGDQDSLTPIQGDVGSFLQQLAKERKSIDFEIISAGHLPHDENPMAVNKAVLEWLAREPWFVRSG